MIFDVTPAALILETNLSTSSAPRPLLFNAPDLILTSKEAGLIDCVCKACAAPSGVLKSAEEQGFPLCDEMSGHPSMAKYIDMGYTVIVI